MAQSSEDLIARLAADLRPVKSLRQAWGMLGVIGALLAGVVGMIASFGLRADIAAGRPDGLMLTGLGLFLVLALASAWAVVDMARPFVGIRREGWGWTALMAGVLPASALVLIAVDWLRGAPSDMVINDRNCMVYGLLWGLLTATVLVFWLRRGAPTFPARAGLLTGVAAGSAGICAVSVYCAHSDLIHIGFWHGLSVVIAGLIGRLIVPRLIAW